MSRSKKASILGTFPWVPLQETHTEPYTKYFSKTIFLTGLLSFFHAKYFLLQFNPQWLQTHHMQPEHQTHDVGIGSCWEQSSGGRTTDPFPPPPSVWNWGKSWKKGAEIWCNFSMWSDPWRDTEWKEQNEWELLSILLHKQWCIRGCSFARNPVLFPNTFI